MEAQQTISGETQVAAVPPEAVVENQPAQEPQERQVPLSALEAERSKRQQMEDENRLYREHIALMQANQRPAEAPASDEAAGIEDSDVMTYGEFKKHASKITGQIQMTIEELRAAQAHPDYSEVISNYLPELLKTNPKLRDTLQKTQDHELAYYLAKTSDAYRNATKKTTRNEDADRIIKNSQTAGSLSSLGASTPVSQAKRYRDMGEEEFRQLVSRNLGN